MRQLAKSRRWVSLLLAAVLAVPVVGAGSVNAAADPVTRIDAVPTELDYFGDRYPALADKDHVFETLTYYELDYLLRNAPANQADANYVILFGGSWQEETQAAIGHINEVAKEYGITSIKNFDTKLAGPENVFDLTKSDSVYGDFTRRYVDLGARYLTNLNDHASGSLGTLSANYTTATSGAAAGIVPPGGAGTKDVKVVGAPFLFIYNKGNTSGPIVASLEGVGSAGSLASLKDGSGADAYKTALRGVFDTISAPGTKQASFKVLTNEEYIKGSYNEFQATNTNRTIFDEYDPPAVIDSVTLDELEYVLEQDGTFVVLIGCAWCTDTQGKVKFVNQVANEYGVDKVYNWDFKLDGGVGGLTKTNISNPRYSWGDGSGNYGGSGLHTRTNNLKITHIFTDFVNTYLPNITSENTNSTPQTLISGTNPITDAAVSSSRIQAPYVFVYDKRNYVNDEWKPIIGHVEIMGSWSTVTLGVTTGNNQYPAERPRNLKIDSLRGIFSRTELAPSGLIGVPPTSQGGSDAKIEGIARLFTEQSFTAPADRTQDVQKYATKSLEYRVKSSGGGFTPVAGEGTAITGLSPGVYEIRYAGVEGVDSENSTYTTVKRTQYPPGPVVELTVPDFQAAPVGLTGTAPTEAAGNGKIAVVENGEQQPLPAGLEYKLHSAPESAYAPVALGAAAIEELTPKESYDVRVAAQTVNGVYHAPSEASTIYVPGYKELLPPDHTQLAVVHPTTLDNNDGQITGIASVAHDVYQLEYKKGSAAYEPVPQLAITEGKLTGLTPDVYSVRYATYEDFNPSPAVTLVIKGNVAAPTGLAGVAPTTNGQSNGSITGVNVNLEYRVGTLSVYHPITGTAINSLAPGDYYVRVKETPSTLPSAETQVTVPAYVPPVTGGGDGGGGGGTGGTGNSGNATEGISQSGNNTVATVAAKVDEETGTAIAVIAPTLVAGLLDKAKEVEAKGEKALLELKVDQSEGSNNIQVTVPRSAFNDLAAGTIAEVKINAGIGTIAFDANALKTIAASEDEGDVSFILTKSELTDEGKEVLGDRPVYDLLVFAGQTGISTFGGSKVTVSLPYTLKRGEDAEALIVYHVTAEGELELVAGSFNPETGAVEFKTTHFSQYIVGYNKIDFDDVASNAWYAPAVTYLAARDITSGTGENEFSPNAQVTRGQFVVLLLNAYGIQPEAAGAANFADAGNTYYTGYLAAAKRLGIANGLEGNLFAPEQEISRQELFTLLYRALNVLGELPAAKAGTSSLASYADSGAIADYAGEAFKALVGAGIITGSDGKLFPVDAASRAEVAQVLYRLLKV